MAMFGMGKKQDQPAPQEPLMQPEAQPSDFVVQEIQRLQQQGMSNSQIVQQLQRQGYKTYQIFDAFNTIDLAGKAGPIDQAVPPDPGMPPVEESYGQPAFSSQSQGMYEPTYDEPEQMPDQEERVEELVEAIVEEKWEELVKNVNKIITWKNVMENRLSILEQRFMDLKMQFDDLNKGVLDKMADYDNNITNVGTEIKAMEQVFSKILPTFTENINELSKLTKQMKQVQK